LKQDKLIRVAGSFVAGLSHIKKNIPCQDRVLSNSANGTTVIALADGAGSYKRPEIGAETVTSYICEYIVNNFNILYNKKSEEIAKIVLVGIREQLINKAKSLSLDVKELSSTILFVGVNNGRYLAGHIGDGMIGYFSDNKAIPLSYPDNDNEYTVFPMNKGALKRFRIYRNDLKKIKGFILMSDGTYDSLYDPRSKQLVDANNIMFEWLQNPKLSNEKVESEVRKTIKDNFLKNSINGDDCSVNILAITDEKFVPSEIREIDMKQVNDNTEHIKQLQNSVESLKTKIQNVDNKLSDKVNKNEFDDSLKGVADKKELNKLQSFIDKSKSNEEKVDKKIKKLEEDLSSMIGDISKINDCLKITEENNLITNLNALLNWKKNVQILLIILFFLFAGLTGLIIKLFTSISG